ncbi:MAG: type II toxin-antitoxin system VapC family toxin, partial [Gemmatimonadaceae bacterium]
MFVVDTNVLIYAADQDATGHQQCRKLVERWRRQAAAWYVTWPIVYEFLRVSTHPKVFRSPWSAPRAWRFVEALLAAPSLGVLLPTARHADV